MCQRGSGEEVKLWSVSERELSGGKAVECVRYGGS